MRSCELQETLSSAGATERKREGSYRNGSLVATFQGPRHLTGFIEP
jgi:hypothetical protein